MEIQSVASQLARSLTSVGSGSGAADNDEFQNVLLDALESADSADAADKAGTEALLAGEVDDIAQTVIDTQKADLTLRLTVQIRNRVIDAYTEVMRMQV
jgi:flagellar hook-basal body complex protein FliE